MPLSSSISPFAQGSRLSSLLAEPSLTASVAMAGVRQATVTHQSARFFRWQALPSEIKLHVLRHLLPEVRYDPATSCLAQYSNEQFRSAASLLRVDRDTFNSLAPTAYSQRTIVFRDPTLFADQLLRHCSTVFRANLRYLILHLQSDEQLPCFTDQMDKMFNVLSAFTELQNTLWCFTIRYKLVYACDIYTRGLGSKPLSSDDLSSDEVSWARDRWHVIDNRSDDDHDGAIERFRRRFNPGGLEVERCFEYIPYPDTQYDPHPVWPTTGQEGGIYLTYRKRSHLPFPSSSLSRLQVLADIECDGNCPLMRAPSPLLRPSAGHRHVIYRC